MDIVFLLYGSAFFALGLAVSVQSTKDSAFNLASFVWLLSAFGFTHGMLAWMDLWSELRGHATGVTGIEAATMLLSDLLLFEFGRRLVRASLSPEVLSSGAGRLLHAGAYLILLSGVIGGSAFAGNPLLNFSNGTRFLIALPASLLTGFGFLLYGRERILPKVAATGAGLIAASCRLAFVAFLGYAFFAGLVFAPADWGPAAWLNEESFKRVFHVPVQLCRAACVVLAAIAVSRLLRIVSIESQQRLSVAVNRAERAKAEANRLALRNTLLESMGEGVFGIDAECRCTFVNSAALNMLALEPDDVVGVELHRIFDRHDTNGASPEYNRCPACMTCKDGLRREKERDLTLKHGEVISVELTVTPIMQDGVIAGAVVSLRDTTDRKAAQRHIEYLSRLYAALSQANQAIVRCKDEGELYKEICHIATTFGGMAMAWIGRLDEASKRITPAACRGKGSEYLDGIVVSAREDVPEGHGPIGISIRENRPVIVQDFQNDPSTVAWHARARQFGWGACAAFPVMRHGESYAVLALYHAEPNAFGSKILELLKEIAADISLALERFDMEAHRAAIQARLDLTAQVFTQSREGLMITGADGRIVSVNPSLCVMSQYSESEMLGQEGNMLASDRHEPEFFRAMWTQISNSGHWQGEVWNRRRDGSVHPVWLSISRVFDATGKVTNFIASLSDITDFKESEERIKRLAHYDTLTGLPNRALLTDRVDQAIRRAQRGKEAVTVIFVDLDRFKHVNDTLGHRIGDALLLELAKRIESTLRKQDTVARLGGDEFIILLPNTDSDGAAHAAEKLIRCISRPCQLEEHDISVTPSIGIAVYPIHGSDFETLSKCADMAMYSAKKDGRNAYRLFSEEMQTRSARQIQLESALRRAQEKNELEIHYQPQVSLKTGNIVGMEALVRWRHPELGMISPAEFIPLAEDTGLILPIGEWVLRTAVEQSMAWRQLGFPSTRVAVNLSAVQFRQHDLIQLVDRILKEAVLPPKCLELELTESVAMENADAAVAVMKKLHQLGVRMSIDDFGTGYSSLSYLKRFPVDKVKIDRSFIRDITTDTEDEAIVRGIIGLASSLGYGIIAEGVETEEQLLRLLRFGCDNVQGYYFCRPLPADQLEDFLKSWEPSRVCASLRRKPKVKMISESTTPRIGKNLSTREPKDQNRRRRAM